MDLFSVALAVGSFLMGKLQGQESGYKKAQHEALERQAEIDAQREWEANYKKYMKMMEGEEEDEDEE